MNKRLKKKKRFIKKKNKFVDVNYYTDRINKIYKIIL